MVRPDAQKIDAFQSNNNLLLSESATIDSKPQLEIYADDVKCSHGCTIGQLDDNALFYMRSRGIGEKEAKAVLTYAFASEVVNNISIPEVKKMAQKLIAKKLDCSDEHLDSMVEKLLAHGWLSQNKKDGYEVSDINRIIENDVPNSYSSHYLKSSLELAQMAISAMSVNKREFQSTVFKGRAEQVEMIKKECRQFLNRIESLCDVGEDNDSVYQLNLNVFPVDFRGPNYD